MKTNPIPSFVAFAISNVIAKTTGLRCALYAILLVSVFATPGVIRAQIVQPAGPIAIVSWGVTNTAIQSRTDLATGSWATISNAVSPYYAPGLEPAMFFRLIYGASGPLPTNLPPVVTNFFVAGVHDQFLVAPAPGVLTGSSDPNGLAISPVLDSNPAHGIVTLYADGSFTYMPNSQYVGLDSFTFHAVDELTSSVPATVFITLTNHAPMAVPDAYAVTAGQVLNVAEPGVLGNDSDPDDDTIAAELDSLAGNGTVQLNPDGSFIYTPTLGFSGPDSFSYHITDGLNSGNSVVVNLSVHITDTAPAASNATYTVVHDQLLTVTAPGVLASASDADGDPLTASLGTGPANGTLDLNSDGSFTYLPNAGFAGADSFTYLANDGLSNSLPGTVTINVTVSQSAADDDTYYVHENTTLAVGEPGVLLNDSNPDNQTLYAALSTGTANGTLLLNTNGAFTYAPNTNFSGLDTFTYKATDGLTNSAAATVTIYVTNRAPVAVTDSYGAHPNMTLSVAPPGLLDNDYDSDGDVLTAAPVSGAGNGAVAINPDGSFTYTPINGFTGTDSFMYCVSDGSALSAPVVVTLNVHATDAPPLSSPSEYIIRPNDTLTVDVAGSMLLEDSDADGDPLTAQLISAPTHGTLAFNTNGTFTYTPNAGFSGLDSLVYQPFDGLLGGGPTPVFIIVTNNMPEPQPDQYQVHFNTTLAVDAPGVLQNDSDLDDEALVSGLRVPTTHGLVALDEDGGFTYIPNTNYTGPDSFTYIASDTVSGRPTTVTINVTDTAPAAADDDYQTLPNTPLVTTTNNGVLANDEDVDFDSLTAALSTGPTNGLLVLSSNGSFIYTPNPAFVGTDTFTYTITDGLLSSAPATVTITVQGLGPVVRPNIPAIRRLVMRQVVFAGGFGNNGELLPDTPGQRGQPLNFNAPQFLELTGTGFFNPFAGVDRAFPYIYANNSRLRLQAKFLAQNFQATDTVKLRGTAFDAATGNAIATFGGGLGGGAGFAAVRGGGLVSSGVQPVAADAAFVDGCTVYDLVIRWEFQVNGAGAWTPCVGQSENLVFRSFRKPQLPTSLTLLGNGCVSSRAVGGVNGLNDTRAILNAMWNQRFVPKTAKRFDGAPLRYYGRWNPSFHIHSIAGLLSTLDGECDTWAQFMIASLQSQGIDIANFVGVRPNTRNGEALLVKKWNFPAPPVNRQYPWTDFSVPVALGDQIYPNFGFFGPPNVNFFGNWQYIFLGPPNAPAAPWTYPAGVPGVDGGQNQPNPVSTFYNHCIVRIGDAAGPANNRYYDPSYGSTYVDLVGMEMSALDGFYHAHGVNTRFDIRASIRNGGGVIAPLNNIPQLPGGNLLERNSSLNLQFFRSPNAYAPAAAGNGQPNNTALNGGAVALVQSSVPGPIKVWIVDSYGRTVNSAAFVTIVLANNPADAKLCNGPNPINAGGPPALNPNRITVQAVNGVASFAPFNINKSGSAFTLRAYTSLANGTPRATAAPTVSQMFDVGP